MEDNSTCSSNTSINSDNIESICDASIKLDALLHKYALRSKDGDNKTGDVKGLITEIILMSGNIKHRCLLNSVGVMFVDNKDTSLLHHAKKTIIGAQFENTDIPWTEFIEGVHDNTSAHLWLHRYVSYNVPPTKHNWEVVCCAMQNYGVAILKGKAGGGNTNEALVLLQRSFNMGYIPSARLLGFYYSVGAKGLKKNKKLSREWYEKSAVKGDGRAMLRVGTAIVLGDKWIVSAYNDNATDHSARLKSAVSLGYCLATGLGVGKNVARAIELWESAAKHGHVIALILLMRTYRFGRYGECKDAFKAATYTSRARSAMVTCASWYIFWAKYLRFKSFDKALALM